MAEVAAPKKYAIVSYIPALHRGYIDFFKRYPNATLYILGTDFIRETPRMERDIRALTPEEIKMLLSGMSLFAKIVVLNEKTLPEFLSDDVPIIMPDEDINHQFADARLHNKLVDYVSVFLRWDRQISTKEFEVSPDRVISENEFDREIITRAGEEAQKSPDWWRQIGAILIRNKKIILAGHNSVLPSEYTLNAFGDPRSNFDAGTMLTIYKTIHAEATIIAEAAKNGISTDGTSLYITTFPCPVCAKSIALAGIKEIYYAKGYSLLDAEDILRAFGVRIIMVK